MTGERLSYYSILDEAELALMADGCLPYGELVPLGSQCIANLAKLYQRSEAITISQALSIHEALLLGRVCNIGYLPGK